MTAYDKQSGECTDLPPLPCEVRDFAMAVLDGVLYVVGGFRAGLRSPAHRGHRIELRALPEAAWEPIAPMLVASGHCPIGLRSAAPEPRRAI